MLTTNGLGQHLINCNMNTFHRKINLETVGLGWDLLVLLAFDLLRLVPKGCKKFNEYILIRDRDVPKYMISLAPMPT